MVSYFFLRFFEVAAFAQTSAVKGKVISEALPLSNINISIQSTQNTGKTDSIGLYVFNKMPPGTYKVEASGVGFKKMIKTVNLKQGETTELNFDLSNFKNDLDEVVVTGTLKEVSRLESPVPVEVYTFAYFRKNPTPNIFEPLQNVNGVRPQLNCNICNTGDIHINGLEGLIP